MARHHLLLTLACVTGAAVAVSVATAEPATRTLPAAGVAPASAPATDEQAAQVGWLDRYGVYNVRQGSWTLIPFGEGC